MSRGQRSLSCRATAPTLNAQRPVGDLEVLHVLVREARARAIGADAVGSLSDSSAIYELLVARRPLASHEPSSSSKPCGTRARCSAARGPSCATTDAQLFPDGGPSRFRDLARMRRRRRLDAGCQRGDARASGGAVLGGSAGALAARARRDGGGGDADACAASRPTDRCTAAASAASPAAAGAEAVDRSRAAAATSAASRRGSCAGGGDGWKSRRASSQSRQRRASREEATRRRRVCGARLHRAPRLVCASSADLAERPDSVQPPRSSRPPRR